MINYTTKTNDWCVDGVWKKWEQMTEAEKKNKLLLKLSLAEPHSEEEKYWKILMRTQQAD